jgi:hypothetical protein
VNASTETAKNKGLDENLTFIESDMMERKLSAASIILCYFLGSASFALRPKYENALESGTRVVMESFSVPGWKPAKTK